MPQYEPECGPRRFSVCPVINMVQTGLARITSCENNSASSNTCTFTHDKSKTMNAKDQAKNRIKRINKKQNPSTFHVHVQLHSQGLPNPVSAVAQIDSGCTRSMINGPFAKASGLTFQPLKFPLQVEGCNHTVLN